MALIAPRFGALSLSWFASKPLPGNGYHWASSPPLYHRTAPHRTAAGQEAREGLAAANARLGALEDVISNLKADREAWRAQAEVLASRPRGVLAKIFRR